MSVRHPTVAVILVSPETDPDHLRRAMLAGARHVLTKPHTDDELLSSVRHVYQLEARRRHAVTATTQPAPLAASPQFPTVAPVDRDGKTYTFYSAKGGVGCTTLACNLAVALRQLTGKEVAIFDCGLLFGDVGIVLNLNQRQTILDLLPRLNAGAPLDGETLRQVMAGHPSGVKVLLAPPSPEKAELITPEHVRRILAALREQFDYVVIDTWPTFEERILHVLDASDSILVPTTLEMPAIKNCKLLLDVAAALSYPPEKIALVLNRADSRGGISVADVERILERRFMAEIVSDGRPTTHSLNEGVPFVMSHPTAPISANLATLARRITGTPEPVLPQPRSRGATGLFRAVFGAA